MKKKIGIFEILVFIFLLLLSLFLIFLLCWGVVTSLKTVDDALYYPMKFPTEGWQFRNYLKLISGFNIITNNADGLQVRVRMGAILFNTIAYAGAGAFFASFTPLIVAYLCARFKDKRLSKVIYVVNLIVMMLPLVGTYPANLKLVKNIGFYNTLPGILVFQTIGFTGLYFLVYYAMVKGVDKSYFEAAYMDGAGERSVLFNIYIPLLKNTFSTVLLLRFIAYWNDYNTPLLYMPAHPTLAFSIYQLSRSNELEFSTLPMRMAAGVFTVFPIVILFIVFRNKLIGNLTVGGVKG